MKRLIWNQLLEWKDSDYRKPLIIKGARQVGKTWLMREFGKSQYEDVIYLNCDDEPQAASLFANDYDIDRILLQLQAISHIKPKPGKTLIILDEIQNVPRGLASLKYFAEPNEKKKTNYSSKNGRVLSPEKDLFLLDNGKD